MSQKYFREKDLWTFIAFKVKSTGICFREKKESTRLSTPQKGYVAAIKDGFGFIETLQHDKEIFFHFSNIEGKGDKLEVRFIFLWFGLFGNCCMPAFL